jgi:hypothetical protein
LDIKLLCEQDGFFPCNQAASDALCCRGGGGGFAWLKSWGLGVTPSVCLYDNKSEKFTMLKKCLQLIIRDLNKDILVFF